MKSIARQATNTATFEILLWSSPSLSSGFSGWLGCGPWWIGGLHGARASMGERGGGRVGTMLAGYRVGWRHQEKSEGGRCALICKTFVV